MGTCLNILESLLFLLPQSQKVKNPMFAPRRKMKGDGTIVPLRLKFADDDGAVHEYTIKGYRNLSKWWMCPGRHSP